VEYTYTIAANVARTGLLYLTILPLPTSRLHAQFANLQAVNLVFEYCETDLETIILDSSAVLSPADVKCHLKMLVSAVAHCHANYVLHRDLKPANLLYSSSGVLKLADFGLARLHGTPGRMMTPTGMYLYMYAHCCLLCLA
jgi:serine/threonine protein kinase